jgi:hypothetical protein
LFAFASLKGRCAWWDIAILPVEYNRITEAITNTVKETTVLKKETKKSLKNFWTRLNKVVKIIIY